MLSPDKKMIMDNVKNLKHTVLVNNTCSHVAGKRDKNFIITQKILKKFDEIELMLKEQDSIK